MDLPQFVVAANRLNLRATPAPQSPIVAVLDKGEVVLRVTPSDAPDWWEIIAGSRRGFVARRFLEAISQVDGPVGTSINDLLWTLTQDALNRVQYRLGSKDSATGAIDCSGWVGEITRKAFDHINHAAGEVVFDQDDYKALNDHSDGIVCAVERRTGNILIGDEVTATALHEGMLVGIDFGLASFEGERPARHYGIDHIVQVVRNPRAETLCISQSSSFGKGVNCVPLVEWLRMLTDRGLIAGRRVFAVDPFAMADMHTAYISGMAVRGTVADLPLAELGESEDTVEARPSSPIDEAASTALTMTFHQERDLYYATPTGDERFFIGSQVNYTDDMARQGLHQGARGQGWIISSGTYQRQIFAEMEGIGPWAHFLWPTVMAESAGLFGRLNTYDRAAFTFGIMQFAAHTPGKNLICLFRRLLKLPTAGEYFPDLTLQQGRVHLLKLDGTALDLEQPRAVKRPNGKTETQLADLMAYLNPDPQEVGAGELKAAARLMLWCARDPDARLAQVQEAVATVTANLKRAAERMPEFKPHEDWEKALWVADILHQGRGTFESIRHALGSAAALSAIGATSYPERIETVRNCIQQINADHSLSAWQVPIGPDEVAAV